MSPALRAQLALVAAKWKGRRFDDTPFLPTAIQPELDPLEHAAPDEWEPPEQLAMQREEART